MLRRLVIILLFTITLAACATAPKKTPLELAKLSFEEQNYRIAYQRLSPLANKGEAEAQYALGYLYYYGYGVNENRKRSEQWFRLASLNGYEKADAAIEMLNQKNTE